MSLVQEHYSLDHLHAMLSGAGALGRHDDVAELLARGADPLDPSRNPLMRAAAKGQARSVAMMLASLPPFDAQARELWANRAAPVAAERAAAEAGEAECLTLIIAARGPAAQRGEALALAASSGSLPCVLALTEALSPTQLREWRPKALRSAAEAGRLDCLLALLPAKAGSAWEPGTLSEAARNGQTACVKALIPLAPDTEIPEALEAASGRGHPECVAALLPFTFPGPDRQGALERAAFVGRAECLRLLCSEPVSDARHAALARALDQNEAECAELLIRACPPALPEALDLLRQIPTPGQHRPPAAVAAVLLSHIEALRLTEATAFPYATPAPARAPRL